MSDYSNLLDTIAAVSTPRGKGGVALIRISGPSAAEISRKIFRPAGKKYPDEAPRYSVFGEIVNPEGSSAPGEPIDTGIAVFFRGPASFTGDDVLEISCHGGVLVTRAVLMAAIAAGARQAERGEFTRRAFAAGKMTLPEAEALGMLLDAGTAAQLKLSHAGMSGTLSSLCASLRSEITALLTDIYARIDFPEEDLGSISEEEVEARINALRDKSRAVLNTYRTGRAVAEGIDTVICGRTNSGKSTLYNRLVGSDDAIVTDVEGTTRDILSATVAFGGATLKLYDTAGIREDTPDIIESIGIGRAIEKIDSAELVFFLIDGTRAPSSDDISLSARLHSHSGNIIALLTKSDEEKTDSAALGLWSGFEYRLRISPKTGAGMEELERLVSGLYIDGSLDLGRDPVISSARQYAALAQVCSALDDASASLEAEGFDISSTCLESAASYLAELDGMDAGSVSADVIDGIFSKFCVGK